MPFKLDSALPLSSLRVFFTLRHTTLREVVVHAFASFGRENGAGRRRPRPATTAPPVFAALYNTVPTGSHGEHGTLSGHALAEGLACDTGFGESVIKRPVEMTIAIHVQKPRAGGRSRVVRFRRRFARREPVEVRCVHRFGDILFQDNDVPSWETTEGDAEAWRITDLNGATLRLRAAYLSFDNINFQRPPRFHNLHLYFGRPDEYVLAFSDGQLGAPAILEDRAPLLHGAFFRTLVVEYTLSLSSALLANQLWRFHPSAGELQRIELPAASARYK